MASLMNSGTLLASTASGRFGSNTSRKWRKPFRSASSRNCPYSSSAARSRTVSLLNVMLYRPRSTPRRRSSGVQSTWPHCSWSRVAVRNGSAGWVGCRPPRKMWMSVVSLARAAGVTGLLSKIRLWIVSTSLVLADMSMMSTRPWATTCSMRARYSARLRKRSSPLWASGDRPGAPMARAMSASLASARMKSLQPCGSAWVRASLTSSDFVTIAGLSACRAASGPRRLLGAPRPRRARDRPAIPGGDRVAARRRGRARLRPHLADARLDLVDDLAQHPGRLLDAEPLLRRQRQLDLLPGPAAADHRRHRQAHVADAVQPLLQRAHRQHAP